MILKDIILVPNVDAVAAGSLPQFPVDLGRDVWLEKLPNSDAKEVMKACEPPGYNVSLPPYDGHLYAFVRQNPPAGPSLWDSDARLQQCVAISRLVRPTSIGFKYSAQLRYTSSGGLKQIFPGPALGGFGAQAWIAQTDHDWLDQTDVSALHELWSQADLPSLPDRLWRAFWYHEYAAWTSEAAIRWVLVTTGIEALINTGGERVSKQFVVRFSALASKFAGESISHTKASEAYRLRSRIAHGKGLNDLIQDHFQLYSLLEDVLRATVRTGISRQDVRQLFASDEAVEEEWPLKSNA